LGRRGSAQRKLGAIAPPSRRRRMPFNFDQMVDEIAEAIAKRALEKINERVQRGIRNGVTKATVAARPP